MDWLRKKPKEEKVVHYPSQQNTPAWRSRGKLVVVAADKQTQSHAADVIYSTAAGYYL